MKSNKTNIDICYIYCIFDGRYFKVGNSKKPYKRLSDLQTGCSDRQLHIGCLIKLPNKEYANILEKELHYVLTESAKVHQQGEWFDLLDEKKNLLQGCMYYCTHRVIGNLDLEVSTMFDKYYDETSMILDLVPIACMF